jgi:hypothetical protein
VDPLEQNNIAKERPQETTAFAEKSRAYLDRPVTSDLLDVEVDEMQLNQLRALGYMLEGEDNEPPPRKKGKKYKVIPKEAVD